MNSESPFRLGIVEGFFGIPWSWRNRQHIVDFLASNGFNTYLYAPKDDRLLRRHWQQPLPRSHHDNLRALAARCRDQGLDFGIGLSPFELYRDFNTRNRETLAAKLSDIDAVGASTLCILFDDMQGNLPDLAARQAEIMAFVTGHSAIRRFILCPTYYSDDPVLDRFFGPRPASYLEDLGARIDKAIDIFWTGPRVFSGDFPAAHLRRVGEQLQRPPLIWDNYPVNDAERLTPFLHLSPFRDSTDAIRKHARGHMANPMNQAMLSRIPLLSLTRLYRGEASAGPQLFEEACRELCPEPLAAALIEDRGLFEDNGLETMSDTRKARLREKYAAFANDPTAGEIIDWLEGRYAFDPACLT